jgi:hypothetical protein
MDASEGGWLVLGKITMVLVTAAALTAGLTANAFAFSGGVSHVVTHPVAMTTGIVTAMPADHNPRALWMKSVRDRSEAQGRRVQNEELQS